MDKFINKYFNIIATNISYSLYTVQYCKELNYTVLHIVQLYIDLY